MALYLTVVARNLRTMAAARRRYRSKSSSGFGPLLLLLVLVAIIVKFFWWIVGVVVLIGLFLLMQELMKERRQARDARLRHYAEIRARANQQHQWVMQGDDRGIYGPECAPLMQYIQYGGTQAPSTTGPPATVRAGPFGT